MIVLMVAAEFSPYTPAGATGSSVGSSVSALSRVLVPLGHDVTVVLPKYPAFEEMGLLVARRLSPLELPGGGTATIFDGQLGSGVKLVLIDAPQFFERAGVYGEGDQQHGDNAARFGFFAHAVAALVRQRQQQGSPFDVVHGHDWPGALAVMQLKASNPALPCLLTVYDPRHAGRFALQDAEALHLPTQYLEPSGALLDDGICVLKGGALAADRLTTPSPSAAEELTDEARYGGLAVAFSTRASVTTGILPGIDYARYNPATDSDLVSRFDAEDLGAKGNCRTALLRELGLEFEDGRPLLALVSAGPRPGVALRELCSQLLRNDVSLVVALHGQAEAGLLPASASGQAAVVDLSTSSGRERRVLAAADIVLCLDDGDSCTPRRAQRYAAVPVACAFGACRDAIVDCDPELETGTGFLFEDWQQAPGAVQRALAACRQSSWARLQRRLARLDLSWERVAHRYQKLYRQLQGQ